MATLVYNNRPSVRPSRAAFNSVLNELLRDPQVASTTPGTSFVPQADILESATGFELLLTLPGVAKDSLSIDFQEGNLVLSGERKAPVTGEENGVKFRRVETAYGTFRRTFRLPDTVDATAIEAELTDGVLRVTLPFDSKKVTKHHIEVR
ncbi:Hsp20/alpha crystallin family protein [Hymenobacter persicinus]|uniref:Hsp20/alpha crystallin family protein n=1 Tax=Hymenobacter persicinus TaxID=2025506 RepID=A0A4Q5LI31_9BACT|nr:Hsp20/alpha crystallin family protein [Hymenobacter persicinus]RYU84328.1 Hsp20/alpha crystallin family protein [Hymenobacter persicinus]